MFHTNRADTWSRKGQYDRAIADADAALRLDARHVRGYLIRASAWDNKGAYDRALAEYDAAIRLEPRQASHYARRSNTVRRKGDFDRALADAEFAIRLDPNFAQGYNSRGNAYDAKGDYDRAIADYDQALRLAPKDAVFHANRGGTWNRKGDTDRALADLDAAIRLDPRYIQAYLTPGQCLGSKARLRPRACRLRPGHSHQSGACGSPMRSEPMHCAMTGNVDRAMADADAAIRLDPNLASGYNSRAITWEMKGDFDRAIADYDQAIRFNPPRRHAFCEPRQRLAAEGRSRSCHGRCRAGHPRRPRLANAHNSRGNIWSAKGDHDRSIADYSEAMRLAPKVAVYYSNRGLSLRRKGDVYRAIADFDQAIRLDATYAVAYTSRGLAFEAKGDRERARGDFNAAIAAPAIDESGKKAQATARTRLTLLAGEPATTTAVASPVFKPESRSRVALVIGNGA